MKLIRAGKDRFIFRLARDEKEVLFQILKFYPLVPPAHHRLSKDSRGLSHDENQALLEQALEEHRRENRRLVLALLNEPTRLKETKSGLQFALTPAEMNWLLQVLNDVRVGAWLALGEPDEIHQPPLNADNARFIMAMEAAGFFETHLLHALGVHNPEKFGEGSGHASPAGNPPE